MSNITSAHSVSRNTRYVEYVDIFSGEGIVPSAGIKDSLLLFDTFNGTNPLSQLHYTAPTKIYQTLNIYLIEGECSIEINGKEETVKKNTLVTVMPENTLKIRFSSPDVQYFMVLSYPKLSNQIFQEIGLTYSNVRLSLHHFISSLSAKQKQEVFDIYKEIKRDILGPDYKFKEAYIHSLLNVLEVRNIGIHKYNPVPLEGDSNSRQYDVYCRFLSLLNKHAIEHRTVQFYAQALNISSKYLSFVCTSYSKKNASSWIDEAVIQKAKAMILVHHYSLSETCEILHFPTVSSFSRFFKRVTGITPKEFAQSPQL
ncbi:MAG: AraC family transcriptional regulator [Bacteroidaceae bacterium]|nr:AraC family transcriptional regulator [Bacteroidaceae bacterium]